MRKETCIHCGSAKCKRWRAEAGGHEPDDGELLDCFRRRPGEYADLLAASKMAADALNPGESWNAKLAAEAYRALRAAITEPDA